MKDEVKQRPLGRAGLEARVQDSEAVDSLKQRVTCPAAGYIRMRPEFF